MKKRMKRFGIRSNFNVILTVYKKNYLIYPKFQFLVSKECLEMRLECRLDERLLSNIIRRKSHWNNAEIGGHIQMYRSPNIYEPDLHNGLQFLHL